MGPQALEIHIKLYKRVNDSWVQVDEEIGYPPLNPNSQQDDYVYEPLNNNGLEHNTLYRVLANYIIDTIPSKTTNVTAIDFTTA